MKMQAFKSRIIKHLGLTIIIAVMLVAFSGMASADAGDVVWSNIQHYVDMETPAGDTVFFRCVAIDETTDGGSVVAGYAEATSVYNDDLAYIIRLDQYGDTLWVRHFGRADYHYKSRAVIVEPDGGFILVGDIRSPYYEIPPSYSETGVFMMKINADGDSVWFGRYNDIPGKYYYNVRNVCKTSDDGYVLFGNTIRKQEGGDLTMWDGFIIKTDSDGNEEWTRHYEGPADEEDPRWDRTHIVALAGDIANDGTYLLTGSQQTVYSENGDRLWIYDNALVMNIDANGDTISTFKYGIHDQVKDICATAEGGYLIGLINRDVFSDDVAEFIDQATVVNVDNANNEIWHYDVLMDSGIDSGYDTSSVARSVAEIPGGGYLLAGQKLFFIEDSSHLIPVRTSQLFISVFDNDGSLKFTRLYEDEFGNSTLRPFIPLDVKIKANGNYLVCGTFEYYETEENRLIYPAEGIVVELEASTVGIEDNQTSQLPEQISLMQNYPNPFNATTQIQFSLNTSDDVTLSVYDLLGRKITTLYDGALNAGTHSITWNGTNESGEVVSSGVYFYRLETSESTTSKQMLLLK